MQAEQISLEEMAQRLSELRVDADLSCYVHGPRGKLRKIPSVLRRHGKRGGFGVDPDFDAESWEDFAEEVKEELEELEDGPMATLALTLSQIADLEAALVIAQALPELEIAAVTELYDEEMRLREYAWFSPAGAKWIAPIGGGEDYLMDAEVFPPYSCRSEEWSWGFPSDVLTWAPLEVPSEAFFRQWKEMLSDLSEEEYQEYCRHMTE